MHGRSPGRPLASRPVEIGVSPSTSFSGAISSVSAGPSTCGGVGSWSRIPLTAGSALSSCSSARTCVVRRVRRQAVVEAADPGLGARLLLAGDVDRGGGIVADQDRRQPGRLVPGRDPGRDLVAHLVPHLLRDRLSVDELRHWARQASVSGGWHSRRGPSCRGTFGMVASTHWLASAAGHGRARARRERVRRRGRGRAGAPGRRAAPERAGRRSAADRLGRRAARDLRAGSGAGGGDDRGLRGSRPDPGHRAAGGLRAGRVRRLDAAAARLRDDGARRRGVVRDRLRARRVPAAAGDRARALDVRRVGAHVAASRGRALRNLVLADTYERIVRSGRARARGADRRRARRVVPRLGGRGDGRPGCSSRRRPGGLLGDGRGAGLVRLPRLDGVQDRPVGPGAGVPAAARAARRASSSASSWASSTSTP